MSDKEKTEYEAALKQLSSLIQTEKLRKYYLENTQQAIKQNTPGQWRLLKELSITQKDVDDLGVIHVAGTKGKGSTCAFTEGIIRHHGYKTFLYSSPHVREVTERFRVNGQPLSYREFSSLFWEVYNKLKHLKDEDNTLMHYYNFLMAMCVYFVLKEKQRGNIDAVIIEVVMGGEFDFTNIFTDKTACGISSLGLDHIKVLGSTIDKIAWHKAGILRKNVPAFTVTQPEEAMKVLYERAKEKETVLTLCPPLNTFGPDILLGMEGEVQKLNAALALMLSREWLKRQHPTENTNVTTGGVLKTYQPDISKAEREGLKNCKVVGRCYVRKLDGITVYLDIAHTFESIQNCLEWFERKTSTELVDRGCGTSVQQVLIFVSPPDRKDKQIVHPLKDYPFNIVIFPPNISEDVETSLDHPIFYSSLNARIDSAKQTKDIWDTWNQDRVMAGTQRSIFCNSLYESLHWIMEERSKQIQSNPNIFFQVLVTGGVSVVGKILRLLDQMTC